jgi:two-component system, NarL family, invasion response regulator UvrY
MKTKIALTDDHVLLRNGLAAHLRDIDYEVVFEADNGIQLIDKLNKVGVPEIVLMDINMPEMDGYDATLWLRQNYPEVKVLALSMYDDEHSIIRMIRNGARGYLLKDSEPGELKAALHAVMVKGFYHSELVTGKLIHSINHLHSANDSNTIQVLGLNERETEFLKLAATEMTYKEIAEVMHVSPRTVDGYRDNLFEKLNLKSRVGLVLFAIRQGIVKL